MRIALAPLVTRRLAMLGRRSSSSWSGVILADRVRALLDSGASLPLTYDVLERLMCEPTYREMAARAAAAAARRARAAPARAAERHTAVHVQQLMAARETRLIDGKAIAGAVQAELKEKVRAQGRARVCAAALLAGHHIALTFASCMFLHGVCSDCCVHRIGA